MSEHEAAQAETDYRYEVRGVSLYDRLESRPVSVFEAGEILNAHEVLLLKEGIWAAKAGLAEAQKAQLLAALEEGYRLAGKSWSEGQGFNGPPSPREWRAWRKVADAAIRAAKGQE